MKRYDSLRRSFAQSAILANIAYTNIHLNVSPAKQAGFQSREILSIRSLAISYLHITNLFRLRLPQNNFHNLSITKCTISLYFYFLVKLLKLQNLSQNGSEKENHIIFGLGPISHLYAAKNVFFCALSHLIFAISSKGDWY